MAPLPRTVPPRHPFPRHEIGQGRCRCRITQRRAAWVGYLDWAVECFCLTTAVARPETQIHTHMCYSEPSDIIAAISNLDADVISI